VTSALSPTVAKLDVPFEQLFKGRKIVSPKGVVLSSYKSTIYVRARPKPVKKPLSPNRQAWVDNFKLIARLSKTPDPRAFNEATALAKGTNWYYRDVLETAMSGKLIRYEDEVRVTTPTARLERTATQAITLNTDTPIDMDGVVWDNNAFWDSGSNPSRITVRSPGLYLLGGNLYYQDTTASGHRLAFLRVNGSVQIANVSLLVNANLTKQLDVIGLYYFHANDYVELCARSSVNSVVVALNFWAVAITPEALL